MKWLTEANLGPQILPPDPKSTARFRLGGRKGDHSIQVFRYGDSQLTIVTGINTKYEQKAWLKTLPSKELQRWVGTQQMEILRDGLEYWPDQGPLTDFWTINKTLRIQDGMKSGVLDACEEEYRAALVIEHSLDMTTRLHL